MRDEKCVVVTGVNGGLGSAIAKMFSSNGYRVIGTDRLPLEPATRPSFIDVYVPIDLKNLAISSEFREQAFQELLEATGGHGVSALINNAAVQNLGYLDDFRVIAWQETLDVNLTAPFYLIGGLANSLQLNAGSVVNISSIHAHLTKPEFFAYATSKAALSALTRNLAVSVGSKFRINAIEPAAVGTEMLKAGFENNSAQIEQLNSFHPSGRIGEPKEVAELALFLCSTKARFIHGECISIAGGIQSRLHDPL